MTNGVEYLHYLFFISINLHWKESEKVKNLTMFKIAGKLRIASALGVCIDSLVKEEIMMNPQIMKLCRKTQQLSEENRKKIITFANRIYNQEKKIKKS